MAAFAHDTFTAADNTNLTAHTLDSGGSWRLLGVGSVPAAITSNRARGGGSNGATFFYADDAPTSPDYSVFCDLVEISATNGQHGVIGRAGLTTPNRLRYLFRRGTTIRLSYVNDAGFDGNLVNISRAYADCNLELSMVGTNIQCFVIEAASGEYVKPDGTTQVARIACIDIIHTLNSQAGYAGVALGNSGPTTRVHVDNFRAEHLGPYPASSTLAFVSTATTNETSVSPSNSLLLSQTADDTLLAQDRQVPENLLELTQVLDSPSHPPAGNILDFLSTAFGVVFPEPSVLNTFNMGSVASALIGVPWGAPWGAGNVNQSLALVSTAVRLVTPAAVTTLALTQQALVSYGLENVLEFVSSSEGGVIREVESLLVLSDAASSAGSLWLRSVNNPMTLTSASGAWSGDDKCGRRYGSPGVIAKSGKLTLTSENGQYSIVLRNPETDNLRRTAFDRIVRETRGGKLIVYRDPSWNVVQTLLFTITAMKRSMITDLQTFFFNTLGQQITLVDWLGEGWVGVVTKPDETFTEDRDGWWTFAFEFEGSKVVGSSASQFLNLTSVSSVVLV